jgi:hypothetical protein
VPAAHFQGAHDEIASKTAANCNGVKFFGFAGLKPFKYCSTIIYLAVSVDFFVSLFEFFTEGTSFT